jgi:predicted enzyme related to lactoylglutathione lyase
MGRMLSSTSKTTEGPDMLRGLATISFYADDVAEAARWYAEFLGIEPYFSVPGPGGAPAYLEFRIGDYEHELGFIDRRFAPKGATGEPGRAIALWHVDDLEATVARLLELGATEYEPITKRSEEFVTASVVDPFGNVLGLMSNPHYLQILERDRSV